MPAARKKKWRRRERSARKNHRGVLPAAVLVPEADFEKVDGVIEAVSATPAGERRIPHINRSPLAHRHVEAVKVIYDPGKNTYEQLLQVFWQHVNPRWRRAVCRPGLPVPQCHILCERSGTEVGRGLEKDLEASGRFDKPIVTDILPLGPFYPPRTITRIITRKPAPLPFYRAGSGRDQFLEKVWRVRRRI